MPSNIKINEVIALLKLHDLLISASIVNAEQEFTGIAIDSRKVNKGDIFVCLTGYAIDGHLYADSAVNNGAALLIAERSVNADISEFVVKNSRLAAAYLSRLFYPVDDDKMKIVGVTGTNGKSTTAYLGYQLAMKLGKNAGFIGTIGYYINDKHYPTSLTTPDIIDISKILSQMQQSDVEIVFIEVSSHALAMHRLAGLNFSAALFLNLSHDHLDFHHTMDEYFACKSQLFYQLKPDGFSLINIDDDYGKKIWDNLSDNKYSISYIDGDIIYSINNLNIDISEFTLTINDAVYKVKSSLSSEFNVQNLSFALACIMQIYSEIKVEEIINKTMELKAVPGRLEKVINPENKNIIIDYAHTPEAIEKACHSFAKLKNGRLITILGAGGNRDKSKRPLMLQAGLKYSDLVIVTTDNPRNEEPVAIIKDIIEGTAIQTAIWLKEDRKSAIMDALYISQPNDIILIAGKGHETYQEIKGIRYPFDDREVIREYYRKYLYKKNYQLYFDEIMIDYVCNNSITCSSNNQVNNIITDTRKLRSDSLFIPLKGSNFDGHAYLSTALEDTSNLALCAQDHEFEHPRVIKVIDPLACYGKIARSYRQLFSVKLIGITGSTGKTSVKEYLYNLLSEHGSTIRTHSNENNYIGVPKTLLKLNGDTKYGIIELGTNHFGEIKWLTQVSLPEIAIITNIGASHLEFLENEAGVFREKITIFSEGANIKIFPGDDPKFIEQTGEDFGYLPERKFRIHGIYQTKNGYSFKINDHKFLIAAKAEFQVTNAAIAIIAAMSLGLTPELIRQGISKDLHLPLRMEIIENEKHYIIADCYNANPQSMQAALKHWMRVEPDKPHVAILGSMLELGENSIFLHSEIGEFLKDNNHLMISVGEDAINYKFKYHYDNVESLKMSNIIDKIPNQSVILLKGSHSIHLEKLLKKYNPAGVL